VQTMRQRGIAMPFPQYDVHLLGSPPAAPYPAHR